MRGGGGVWSSGPGLVGSERAALAELLSPEGGEKRGKERAPL